ncbi:MULTISPECIES: ABC transporter ATP-binding protein [unclassified Brucella]|uniref:ABC transporter ATP-binding protein n=1 Tax=unclassified Brucella TaxID=2632610 RepID=UPI0012AE1AD2|nr:MULTISPECIES: ABC transporter ATP-binding protein [unclassified Brucella]MRN57457.1 ATP-binding cassette domain-containing protein [Brucella sp. 09RB8918]CAB4325865.1 iron ABC transporter ATP-binding protein [Brucella sp. 191011898]
MDAHNLQDERPGEEKCRQHSGTALSLSGICRQFGTMQALNHVSLDVEPGEIICLVGHSGCGKTSLLRIIAGIDAPDSGTLTMGGKTLVSNGIFVEPEKRNVGVVFQDYALFPHLTVRENVRFGLSRMRRSEANARAGELLDLVGLGHMADRYPHMLSGGEQQRVALIRALAPKPHVLLMDEPFSNLDRGLRARVRRETVSLLRALGTTAIIVTHEAEEALSTGDRVVLMRSGQIVQSGSPRDLHDCPVNRYAADFFCDFNAIPAEVHGDTLVTPFGRIKKEAGFPSGSRVVVYLRPCDIAVLGADDGNLSLHGRIEARTYLGESEELVVKAGDMPLRLHVRGEAPIPSGLADVSLCPHWEKALVFPAAAG